MKKILLIAVFFLCSVSYCQNKIDFGVKAGVNSYGFHTFDSARSGQYGLNFGGIAQYGLSNRFFIYSEIAYNRRGGTNHFHNGKIDYLLDYIDIPLQIKYKFLRSVSFDLGIQFGVLIDKKAEIVDSNSNTSISMSNTDTINGIDFSANTGFSFKINSKLILQTRYNLGLIKVLENENYRNSMISLSLAYFFK